MGLQKPCCTRYTEGYQRNYSCKPQGEIYYNEYKDAITQIVVNEEHLNDLPVFYNVNFGHAKPIGIIPYGIQAKLDCKNESIVFLECPTV